MSQTNGKNGSTVIRHLHRNRVQRTGDVIVLITLAEGCSRRKREHERLFHFCPPKITFMYRALLEQLKGAGIVLSWQARCVLYRRYTAEFTEQDFQADFAAMLEGDEWGPDYEALIGYALSAETYEEVEVLCAPNR